MGVPAGQAAGHVDRVRVDGEVDERPLLELEDEVRWVAVVLVLVNGVAPGLAGHGVLELDCSDRDAVERQRHVQAVAVPIGVPQLADNHQPIGRVEFPGLRVEAADRREVGGAEELAEALEAVA